MKQSRAYAAAGLLLALLAACSSIPANQPDLVRARSSYTSAKAKAWVNEYAPVEMYEAEQALQRAEQARSVDEMKHLSYIADRKVQIAVAVANRKLSSDATATIAATRQAIERVDGILRSPGVQASIENVAAATGRLRRLLEEPALDGAPKDAAQALAAPATAAPPAASSSTAQRPPLPPSPPSGPPRGTNFSRRKATTPSPPAPAFT